MDTFQQRQKAVFGSFQFRACNEFDTPLDTAEEFASSKRQNAKYGETYKVPLPHTYLVMTQLHREQWNVQRTQNALGEKKVYRHVVKESRGQISNGRVIDKRRQENGTNISVYFKHRTMTGALIKNYVRNIKYSPSTPGKNGNSSFRTVLHEWRQTYISITNDNATIFIVCFYLTTVYAWSVRWDTHR